MREHDRAEIVGTTPMLGGARLKMYVYGKHTGRITSVCELMLTERDLEYALDRIRVARLRHQEESQGKLAF